MIISPFQISSSPFWLLLFVTKLIKQVTGASKVCNCSPTSNCRVCSGINVNPLFINYVSRLRGSICLHIICQFCSCRFCNRNRSDYNRTGFFKPKPEPNPNRRLRFSILKTEDIRLRFRFYPETEPNRPMLSPTCIY